jgi:hypothetical protein
VEVTRFEKQDFQLELRAVREIEELNRGQAAGGTPADDTDSVALFEFHPPPSQLS